MAAGDHLVVLRSRGIHAAKRFSVVGAVNNVPQIAVQNYGQAKHFGVEEIFVAGFDDLAETLTCLSFDPFASVIRGAPLPGIDRQRSRRLLYPDRDVPATFAAAARHWFMTDFDGVRGSSLSDPVGDPEGIVEDAIGMLPAEFTDVSCWWQMSSSMGVRLDGHDPDAISIHLWFWSKAKLSDAELMRKAAEINRERRLIDPAMFRPVQLHYVAAPLFTGMTDPLPRRSGIRRGLDDSIELVIPPVVERGNGAWGDADFPPGIGVEGYLEQIGGSDGFRRPILGAIASYIATYGAAAGCESLKEQVRAAVQAADPGGRDTKTVGRYISDEHLDEMISWVRKRQGETVTPPPLAHLRLRSTSDEAGGEAADEAADLEAATDGEVVGGTPNAPLPEGIGLVDFYALMTNHSYIFVPTRELWPAESINGRLPKVAPPTGGKLISPARWLDRYRAVDQMIWAPGEPPLLQGRLLNNGGWIERPGTYAFNIYTPPTLEHGDPGQAGPWLDHIARVYPEDAGHIVQWLAHRVQHPGEKINHALVLGGVEGVGKDSILAPVREAVGPWNFGETSPRVIIDSAFTGFLRSVILRISEARDLGESDRFKFNEHTKGIITSPPEVHRVNEKYVKEYYVLNVVGVVFTTNHKTGGLYLSPHDRRHYVAWSPRVKTDFPDSYWNQLHSWYAASGSGHVAAYLVALDLGDFDPMAPPPQTEAWFEIVSAHRTPESNELADALDKQSNPDATTLRKTSAVANESLQEWLGDRRNRRAIPHRFEEVGYVTVRNPYARDGQWVVGGRRETIYARAELSLRDRTAAANQLRLSNP